MNFPTAQEQLTTAIMPNDTVKHHPTGEEWVVCGVNYERGELIEKRYSKGGQPEEYIKALQKEGLTSFIDVKSAMFAGII